MARWGGGRPHRADAPCSGRVATCVAGRPASWIAAQQRAGVIGGHRGVGWLTRRGLKAPSPLGDRGLPASQTGLPYISFHRRLVISVARQGTDALLSDRRRPRLFTDHGVGRLGAGYRLTQPIMWQRSPLGWVTRLIRTTERSYRANPDEGPAIPSVHAEVLAKDLPHLHGQGLAMSRIGWSQTRWPA